MAGNYQSPHIKTILFFLLSFLFGTQNTSAKTKLNVGQNGIVKQANIEIYKNAQGVLNTELNQQYVGQMLDMLLNVESMDKAHWTVNFAKNKDRTFEIVINNTLHTKTADNIENFNEIVKLLWQKAFTEYATQTFSTIWNNPNLRTSLFDINSSISPLDQFNNLVSNTNSVLYSFIKAE